MIFCHSRHFLVSNVPQLNFYKNSWIWTFCRVCNMKVNVHVIIFLHKKKINCVNFTAKKRNSLKHFSFQWVLICFWFSLFQHFPFYFMFDKILYIWRFNDITFSLYVYLAKLPHCFGKEINIIAFEEITP